MCNTIHELENVNFINKYIPTTILITKMDESFTLLQANDEYFKLLGYSKEEIRDLFGNSGFATLHEEDRFRAKEELIYQLGNNQDGRFSVLCRVVNKEYGYKTIKFDGCLVIEDSGEPELYFVLTDFSEHIELLNELNEEREFNEIIASLDDVNFVDINIREETIRYSRSITEILGIEDKVYEFPQGIIDTNIVSEERANLFVNMINNTPKDCFEDEVRFDTVYGKSLWFECSFKIVRDLDGNAIRLVGKMTNITSYREKINELNIKADTDGLTDLLNKRATKQFVDNYLKNDEINSHNHAFMIIDIDNLKKINDTLGHSYGDKAIKDVGLSLRNSFRDTDIIGRIGGDEFIVFIKKYNKIDDVRKKAKDVLDLIDKEYSKEGQNVRITASIGISLYSEHAINYTGLYECADSALYNVKRNGKNSYNIYLD